jgi:hypothetical protein
VLRGDLNLQEVGKGQASPASNLLPIKTLAEIDFNSYRPLDLATIGQSSGKPFWGSGSPVPRGAGQARLTKNCCAAISDLIINQIIRQ